MSSDANLTEKVDIAHEMLYNEKNVLKMKEFHM